MRDRIINVIGNFFLSEIGKESMIDNKLQLTEEINELHCQINCINSPGAFDKSSEAVTRLRNQLLHDPEMVQVITDLEENLKSRFRYSLSKIQ